MASAIEVKYFIESKTLLSRIQTDVEAFEQDTNDVTKEIADWQNLESITDDESLADVTHNAATAAYLNKVSNDAETYLKSFTVQVGSFDTEGAYENLYTGGSLSVGEDDDGNPELNENGAHAVTLWDIVSDPTLTLSTQVEDFLSPDGDPREGSDPGDWALDNNIQFPSFGNQPSLHTHGKHYETVAQGSVADWAPYIKLSGGDPNALQSLLSDAFLA
jgi:hypothetical protein